MLNNQQAAGKVPKLHLMGHHHLYRIHIRHGQQILIVVEEARRFEYRLERASRRAFSQYSYNLCLLVLYLF